jgi:pimeloyl-ACP methyl ester carboxylesterase
LILTIWFVASMTVWLAVAALTVGVWLALVLAAIPGLDKLPLVGRLVKWMRMFVVKFAGDTYVLQHDGFGARSMLTKVKSDLAWLEERSDRVVVVAHSQGASLALRALQEDDHPKVRRLVTLGSALRALARGRGDLEIDRELAPPGGVPWYDLYASADAVPAGSLWRIHVPADGESVKVYNRHALVRDHVVYGQNTEQVVAPIALMLAETTLGMADRRARWETLARAGRDRRARVLHLAATRWLHIAGWAAALVILGGSTVRRVGRHAQSALHSAADLIGKDQFLKSPQPELRWITGALAILLAATLLYSGVACVRPVVAHS